MPPKDVTHFDQMDGIWASRFDCVLPCHCPAGKLDREAAHRTRSHLDMYGDLQGIAGQSPQEIDLNDPYSWNLGTE